MKDPKFTLHEWIAAIGIIILIFSLALISHFHKDEVLAVSGPPHHLLNDDIEVLIEGAVKHPQHYTLKKGARVKEVLEMAQPLPEADLSKIKWETKIRDGQTIVVPLATMITIFLEGEIENPGPLLVKKGCRFCDIHSLIQFKAEADSKPFLKKRKLKNNEVITVGKQKLKKKKDLIYECSIPTALQNPTAPST